MAYILACGHHVAHQDQPHYCAYLGLNELLDLQSTAEQLLDTMAPTDFFTFRPCLSPASGPEGQQLREVELVVGGRDAAYREGLQAADGTSGAATSLWTERLSTLWNNRSLRTALQDLLARRNLTPDRIYVDSSQANPHIDLFLLLEELLDFDETMMLWRSIHAQVAERPIRPALSGSGGSTGVAYLRATALSRCFFPDLWDLRTSLWEQRGHSAHQPPAESNNLCPALTPVAMAGHQS